MTNRMVLKGFVVAWSLLALPALAWGVEARGAVESVTVYRGQALVTRIIEIDAPAGPAELIVTDLPERVLGDSLFASGQEGVQVRAAARTLSVLMCLNC